MPPRATARRFGPLGLLLSFLLLLASCAAPTAAAPASGASVPVAHAQGTTDVPANPAKIVVLDYAGLDIVDALGAGDRVVGTPQASLPPALASYRGRADVGTIMEPDLEKIAALGPDLVIVGGRSAAKYADVSKVAPTVDFSVNSAKPLESLKERTRAIAALFAAESAADEKLAALEASIAETRTLAGEAGKGLIVLSSGGKVSAFGPGGRFGGLIHDALGVEPAASELKVDNHGQAISFEFISEKNPDSLFVIDRDAAIGQQGKTAEQVLDNALVARTKAWKNDRVTYLDGTDWYVIGNGLGATQRMVDAVRGALTP